MHNVLLWNFSQAPVGVELMLKGIPTDSHVRHIVLDAAASAMDENLRLRPDPFFKLDKGDQRLELNLEAYAVHYWSFE
jgi:hypothetical protein